MTEAVEAVVVGAGVVGLAVARALAVRGHEVMVLERNEAIGQETSSRNSEVIHAGLHYAPGSLKAELCRTGKEMLYAYCTERGIDHRRCGKLIIASNEQQVATLDRIRLNAMANGVLDLGYLSGEEAAAMEPAVVAKGALFSPSSGVVDSHALMVSLLGDIETAGGMVVFRTAVAGMARAGDGFRLSTVGAEAMDLSARLVVNAAGLGAQSLAASLKGVETPPLHYAIGHYYALTGRSPFSHLVYPVPEVGGLGVHVTLDLAGQARFGPDLRWIDRIDYTFDDSHRADFVAAVKRYYPGLNESRLYPAYAGIRPKLVGRGEPAVDFRIDGPDFHGVPGLVNLFGIESPGLTACLALGEAVALRLGL